MKLLNWTVERTLQWYKEISIFYFILIIPFFWGTIWSVFKLSAVGLAALMIPVSPRKKFSLYTISVFSIINTMALIGFYWSRDIDYSWRTVLMTSIITVFILDFSTTIVLVFAKKERLYAQSE
jgi:hypothetical protein